MGKYEKKTTGLVIGSGNIGYGQQGPRKETDYDYKYKHIPSYSFSTLMRMPSEKFRKAVTDIINGNAIITG